MARSTNSNPSKSKSRLVALITGLQVSLPPGVSQLLLTGKAWQVSDVIAELNQYLALQTNAEQTKQAHALAVDERRAADPDRRAFVGELELSLRSLVGPSSVKLTSFGLLPKAKPKPLSSDALVARAQKSEATRNARHTMGKKQKQAIHGVVPQPVATTQATNGVATEAPTNGVAQILKEGDRKAS